MYHVSKMFLQLTSKKCNILSIISMHFDKLLYQKSVRIIPNIIVIGIDQYIILINYAQQNIIINVHLHEISTKLLIKMHKI